MDDPTTKETPMATAPSFYNPDRVGTLFYPNMAAVAGAAAEAGLPPASATSRRVLLLIVDMQIDFCHDHGALYVPGAQDDIRRLSAFIFEHAATITDVVCTLDSHLPLQIFHPAWWAGEDGNHPEPLTLISAEDVAAGRWRPLVMPDWSQQYVERLEEQHKKVLTIWPYHVLIGGIGNSLDPALFEVVQWHSLARNTQPAWLRKGRIPQSEHYSALRPEIPVPAHPHGELHEGILDALRGADLVFVAGEAQSHCVLETLEDIVAIFGDEEDGRETLGKFYVLTDCTSSVLHPQIDFEALSLEAFDQFARRGVHFVKSTDPLPFLEQPAPAAEPGGDDHVLALHRMTHWD
jgi:nicotinamidase/pyrazinamidase